MLTWRYLPYGRVAHAIPDGSSPGAVSMCGRCPDWFRREWYGTGCQAEYEHAAELPRCKQCLDQIRKADLVIPS